MCVCVASILNHTHQLSSWQKHQESSSQAIAYIWPAQACTHNTAHNNVDWVKSYAAAQTFEIACMLSRFVWWFKPTSVGREHTEEREKISSWIQTIPELSQCQRELNEILELTSAVKNFQWVIWIWVQWALFWSALWRVHLSSSHHTSYLSMRDIHGQDYTHTNDIF